MPTLLTPDRISQVQRHLARTFAADVGYRGRRLVGDATAVRGSVRVGGGLWLWCAAAGVALRGELIGFALGRGHGVGVWRMYSRGNGGYMSVGGGWFA